MTLVLIIFALFGFNPLYIGSSRNDLTFKEGEDGVLFQSPLYRVKS